MHTQFDKKQENKSQSLARIFFVSMGSPQIKEIHKSMETSHHPLLSKPAGIITGWTAGMYENKELVKLPNSGDWRDDKFAKSTPAYAFRPFAAAAVGGGLSALRFMSEGERENIARKTGNY